MAVSWPFDSTVTQDGNGNPIYSRAYSSDVIARLLARYFRNGVFPSPSTGLQVLQNEGLTVLVKEGAANINGRQFYEEQDRVLTVQAADTDLDRIDTVVLRLNLELSALNIDLYILKGTAGATPAAPELTRNASVWELGLANLFIAKGVTTVTQERVTDTRLDSSRCGVVASIVGDTDTTSYYVQIQANLEAFRTEAEASFAQWSAEERTDFNAWFTGVRNTLGEDVAGSLLSLIQQHAPLTMSAQFSPTGWSAAAPYAQTVAVDGLLTADTPLADVVLSDVTATAQAQLEAYALIGRLTCGNGTLTALCYEEAPVTALSIALKVVR